MAAVDGGGGGAGGDDWGAGKELGTFVSGKRER
jgi:hypothetical protein